MFLKLNNTNKETQENKSNQNKTKSTNSNVLLHSNVDID